VTKAIGNCGVRTEVWSKCIMNDLISLSIGGRFPVVAILPILLHIGMLIDSQALKPTTPLAFRAAARRSAGPR